MKILFVGFLFLFPIYMFAQTGTIKIFTELSPVKVFLDEELKGIDVRVLDSVQIGSHYLKVTKDDVIVYGELVTVAQGAVTTILLKNDKEVQAKILDAKFKEQEEYKLQKIEILMSTNYSTETKEKSVSTHYPGYYVANTATLTSSNAQTTAYTDWFVVQGGVNRISEVQFATLTNNTDALKQYQLDKDNLDRIVKNKSTAVTVCAIIALGFIIPSIILMSNDNDAGIGLAIPGLIFAYPILSPHNEEKNIRAQYKWKTHYMSCETALKNAQIYNQELKKKLGLPENYEPTK